MFALLIKDLIMKFNHSVLYILLVMPFTQIPSDALSQDAADPIVLGLMRDFNLDSTEATRRAAIMSDAADLAEKLEASEPVRFAGLYIEHSPTFRVVVKLVGNADGLLARYTSRPEIVAEKASNPLRALLNKQQAITKSLGSDSGTYIVGIDVKSNRVIATITRGKGGAAKLKSGGHGGTDALIEEVDKVATPIIVYGGLEIKSASWPTNKTGISYSDSASAGFNVRHSSGTKGVTTAAHFDECNVTGVRHPDGTPVTLTNCTKNTLATFIPDSTTLTFRAQQFSSGSDVEWRTSTDQTRFKNEIQYGGGGYAYTTMRVTSVGTLRGSMPVCKQGLATFYTCGTTSSAMVTFQDPDGIITGSYWLVAKNSGGAMAGPGDSGGPVFGGGSTPGTGVALGTNTAVVEGGSFAGQLVVMPVQRFSTLGITVMTAP
jgi:hypothetical protein